jgi:hypothetical protein
MFRLLRVIIRPSTDLIKVRVLAARQPWWNPGSGAAGQPAEVGILILYAVSVRRVTVERQKVCFGWVCKSKMCFGYGVELRALRSPNGRIV